jgi:tetratricopeptide (TPR) repeat protein
LLLIELKKMETDLKTKLEGMRNGLRHVRFRNLTIWDVLIGAVGVLGLTGAIYGGCADSRLRKNEEMVQKIEQEAGASVEEMVAMIENDKQQEQRIQQLEEGRAKLQKQVVGLKKAVQQESVSKQDLKTRIESLNEAIIDQNVDFQKIVKAKNTSDKEKTGTIEQLTDAYKYMQQQKNQQEKDKEKLKQQIDNMTAQMIKAKDDANRRIARNAIDLLGKNGSQIKEHVYEKSLEELGRIKIKTAEDHLEKGKLHLLRAKRKSKEEEQKEYKQAVSDLEAAKQKHTQYHKEIWKSLAEAYSKYADMQSKKKPLSEKVIALLEEVRKNGDSERIDDQRLGLAYLNKANETGIGSIYPSQYDFFVKAISFLQSPYPESSESEITWLGYLKRHLTYSQFMDLARAKSKEGRNVQSALYGITAGNNHRAQYSNSDLYVISEALSKHRSVAKNYSWAIGKYLQRGKNSQDKDMKFVYFSKAIEHSLRYFLVGSKPLKDIEWSDKFLSDIVVAFGSDTDYLRKFADKQLQMAAAVRKNPYISEINDVVSPRVYENVTFSRLVAKQAAYYYEQLDAAESTVDSRYAVGVAHHLAGNLEEAEIYYRKDAHWYRRAPDKKKALIYFRLGLITWDTMPADKYKKDSHNKRALSYFRKAIDYDSTLISAYVQCANCLRQDFRKTEAQDMLDDAIRISELIKRSDMVKELKTYRSAKSSAYERDAFVELANKYRMEKPEGLFVRE